VPLKWPYPVGHEAKGDRVSQTVCVLEDDPDISRLVQHHLEAAGFGVRVYSTPANLVPDAERQAPVLFLLDIMVPGGDGLDVCRRLRSNPALSTIPIIFLTARAGENDRVLGLELGADDYITKPFATRELIARVKAVLRRFERPTAPSIISFEEVLIDAGAMQLKVRGELTTTTGISTAGLPGPASWPRLQPRSPARCRLGGCPLCHPAFRGRLCAAHP
jgi:DNA-binding response OmpR family regulator